MNNSENKVFTIPNLLSFFRLLLIPAILVCYFHFESYLISAILLLVSAATDIIDGFIARKFNMVSNLGKILDPIADKLTQVSVLICLCFENHLIILPALVLIIKELASGIIGLIVVKRIKHNLSAEWHGKLATVLIYTTMMVHLFWLDQPKILSYILIGLSVAIMILSFILYLRRYVKILKENPKNKQNLDKNAKICENTSLLNEELEEINNSTNSISAS